MKWCNWTALRIVHGAIVSTVMPTSNTTAPTGLARRVACGGGWRPP